MKTVTLKNWIRFVSILLMAGSQNLFGQLVTNEITGNTYSTIQAAIDDPLTLNGHTLTVDPGIYVESILVNKELSIYGPKMSVDGNHASRGTGEAIIYPPAVLYGDGTFNGGYLMRVTADNVTVDGFTFDGDNPLLEGVYGTGTGNFDIDFGIMSYWSPWYEYTYDPDDYDVANDLAGDNLSVKNNIFKNFKLSAIIMWSDYFNPDAKTGKILHNKIQNSASSPAIYLSTNYYADVEYNTILDCWAGVFVYFYYYPDPTGTGGTIRNNSITSSTIEINWGEAYTSVTGVLYHFIYAFADPWTISDNTIANTTLGGAESSGIVIVLDATEDPMVVSNNNISGFDNGYRLSTNYFGTLITGGNLTNNRYGVTVSNFDFNGNYPAEPSDFSITGMNIQNSLTAGVFVDDNASSLTHATVNANVSNCFINGGPIGILVNSPAGSATAHENDLSDNSLYAIQAIKVKNLNPVVDATCNWFGHWSGPENAFYSGGLGSAVSGHKVTFAPWLTDGTDDDVTAGFQPVPGSCDNNCGNKFYNLLVCHNDKTLCIPVSDAFSHVAHGDDFGECELPPYAVPDTDIPETFDVENLTVLSFPNPFANSTTIKYGLSSDSKVTIKVYDAIGREVASLIDSERAAGVYTFDFDASVLGNGVYYYMVIANTSDNEFVQTGKMIKL